MGINLPNKLQFILHEQFMIITMQGSFVHWFWTQLETNLVFCLQKNDEFSVAVAVRLHKTLELAGDKFYMITCGKAGFQNTR